MTDTLTHLIEHEKKSTMEPGNKVQQSEIIISRLVMMDEDDELAHKQGPD